MINKVYLDSCCQIYLLEDVCYENDHNASSVLVG